MKNKINELLKNKKFVNIAAALLAIVGLILVFSASHKTSTTTKAEETFNSDQYVKALEEKIKTISESISGVEANVSITIESTNEYVYRDTQKTASEKSEQDIVIVKDGSGAEEGLIITEKMPQIRGVVVVVKGADENSVKKIEESVAALLNIRHSKVFVTK